MLLVNEHSKQLDQLIESSFKAAEQAAKSRELLALQRFTREVSELVELKQQNESVQHRIQHRIANLGNYETAVSGTPASKQADNAITELPIEITDGMLRQYYLALTPHIKRGKIHVDETMTIEAFPSGERFVTKVLEKGNKLQERGAIRRFFADAHVNAGDFVLLKKNVAGHWTLQKAPDGMFSPSERKLVAPY